MAHFEAESLTRPSQFNFADDVVDYWASKDQSQRAMYWVSEDGSQIRELTFTHFSKQSHRIAVMLQKLGVKAGERMLIIMPRVPEWWETVVASIRSGILYCPATTLLAPKDIEFRCQASEATMFLGDSASVAKMLSVRKNCPKIKTIVQIDGSPAEGVVSFHKKLDEVPSDATFAARKNGAEEPALIYFTSGTSGPPKMVLHSHISYPLASTITGKHWMRLSPSKLFWNVSEQAKELYKGWAKAGWAIFGTWNCGASLFVHDDRRPFKPQNLLEILHKFPVTTLCAPPTAYRQLVLQESKDFYKANPPLALEHCIGAGEPLNDEVIRQWQRMSNMEICDGYGQTETILVCGNFANSPIRPGSMGKPSPGVPLAIIDAEGNDSPAETEGEVGIEIKERNPGANDFFGLFDGYMDTAGGLTRRVRKFAGKSGESRAWYLTGDRAWRDKDGYFWFVGRADDVINSAGYRIGPFEVESTLKQHPGVIESAVVASPDQSRGEVVKAFIVLTDEYAQKDAAALTTEIQSFCKENAAPYKYPRKIQFVDAAFLPKTISGKIKRNELKKMEWEGGNEKAKL